MITVFWFGNNDFQFLIICKLYSLFDLWYLERKHIWSTLIIFLGNGYKNITQNIVFPCTLFYRVLFIWQFSTDWLKLLLLWPACTVYSTGAVQCTVHVSLICSTIAHEMQNLEKSLLCILLPTLFHLDIREIERVRSKLIRS